MQLPTMDTGRIPGKTSTGTGGTQKESRETTNLIKDLTKFFKNNPKYSQQEANLIISSVSDKQKQTGCFGCGMEGHIRADCPTNPWTKPPMERNKRGRQGHTGETPQAKQARTAKQGKTFPKATFGWNTTLVLTPLEGKLTQERAEDFRYSVNRWIVDMVREVGEEGCHEIPEIDKVRTFPDRIEVQLPTIADREKFIKAIEGENSGYKIQSQEEYEASKEKIWRFTGLIKLDETAFGIQELNDMVTAHKWKKSIKGRLEITQRFGEAPNGSICELIANEQALKSWPDRTINFGLAGRVLFSEKKKGERKTKAGKKRTRQ